MKERYRLKAIAYVLKIRRHEVSVGGKWGPRARGVGCRAKWAPEPGGAAQSEARQRWRSKEPVAVTTSVPHYRLRPLVRSEISWGPSPSALRIAAVTNSAGRPASKERENLAAPWKFQTIAWRHEFLSKMTTCRMELSEKTPSG